MVIYQCTLGIWNKTTVDNLITLLSDKDVPADLKGVAHTLLKDLASSHPKLFKDFIGTLANWFIAQTAELSPDRSREEKAMAEDILKCLSRLNDLDLPGKQGNEFIEALKTFALSGETEIQGRRATAVLLKLKRRNVHAEDLVNVSSYL